MRVLSSEFFREWTKPVLNIHPSLLPDFKGLHAQQQAFKAGVTWTGCTVHYVDQSLDGGEIIEQMRVRRTNADTLQTLTNRILSKEHKLYPKVLKKIADNILETK